MSATSGYDKRVDAAVRFLLAAPGGLSVPQAMRAANFTNEESSNRTIQQRVRREWQSRGGREVAYLTPPTALALSTPVTAASSLTGSSAAATATTGEEEGNHQQGGDDSIIKKPVLLKVRATATAKQKLRVNKVRVAKFHSMALKYATSDDCWS
jgi:hypothetical protein